MPTPLTPLLPEMPPQELEGALRDLSRAVFLDPEAALPAILERGASALRATGASLWLLSDHGARLVCRYAFPPREDGGPAPEVPAHEARGRLRALGEMRVVEGPGGLEAAVWRAGEVAGLVRVERAEGWTAAERLFAASLADGVSLALERDARLRAERALRDRERQVEEVEHIARLGSWEWDLEADRIAWSREQLRIHGLDDGASPRTFDEFLRHVHEDDRRAIVDVCERLAVTGEPFSIAYRVVRPDGAVRILQARGQMLPDAAGELTRMVGSSQDVTERREIEAALRASEELLRRQNEELERRVAERTAELAATNEALEEEVAEHEAAKQDLVERTQELEGIFRALPDLYFRMRPDGTIEDFRAGSANALHVPPEVFLGRRMQEVLPGEIGGRLAGVLEEVALSGRLASLEYSLPVGDAARDFEARVVPLEGGSVIAVVRDMTERKEVERELLGATEAAERANRAKSEFLSRMSHELRTPLNSVLGFAQVLERAGLPPAHEKSLQHILRAGRHLLHLINEVLEIARIESGRQSLSLEPVRIGAVLQEAVGLVRPLAEQWGVRLEEASLPDGGAYVRADRQRLTQVLLNLLSNAIKYNHRGGSVRIGCARPEGEDPLLAVRVEDTGPGIPAGRVHQLFTPFARLGAEQTEIEGTGLGLALSQRLTEAMGGALSLERTGPEGSVFRLDLQRVDDPLERVEEAHLSGAAAPEAPHGSATLLYVEDNLANLSLVETILLSRPGWRTVPALQGQLGVELAREHRPDVVLLDLHLPDIPGEEVLRRLRADERTARIPVVVISADATRAVVDRLRDAGADAYLTKPLDIDAFLDTVERFLPQPDSGR